MARHTLYAYVDGSNLHDVAAELESHLERFVAAKRGASEPLPSSTNAGLMIPRYNPATCRIGSLG